MDNTKMNKAALFLKELRDLEAKHGFSLKAEPDVELDYDGAGDPFIDVNGGLLYVEDDDGFEELVSNVEYHGETVMKNEGDD